MIISVEWSDSDYAEEPDEPEGTEGGEAYSEDVCEDPFIHEQFDRYWVSQYSCSPHSSSM